LGPLAQHLQEKPREITGRIPRSSIFHFVFFYFEEACMKIGSTVAQPRSEAWKFPLRPSAFRQARVEAFAAAGVHRLVLLPNHEASHPQRHSAVPLGHILRNFETVSWIAAAVGN
jgi:hypothetical protein